MLAKYCPRCKRLMPYGGRYCPDCTTIVQKQRAQYIEARKKINDKSYNKTKRDPKYVRFYNSREWSMLRDRYKQDKGFRCEVCGAIASDVHHKQAIQTSIGWELRLSYDNLELLCKKCHNDKHDRFKKRKNRLKQ